MLPGKYKQRLTLPLLCHCVVSSSLLYSAIGAAESLDNVNPSTTAVEPYSFNVEGGDLDRALVQFGQQSGVMISVSGQLSQNKHTSGLQGKYSVSEALTRLLKGTGLAAFAQQDGSYIIKAAAAIPAVELDDQTVYGKILSGEYRNDFADSATKTYTRDLDIPQAVDVINRELIDGQMSLNLDQVYRNSASVNVVDPLGHTNIRGFRLNENSGGILKNGLREVSQGFAFQPLANIEKVEVLKGANSALYGRGEPGGVINLITKKPEQGDFLKGTVIAGSDDFYQANLDANKAISEKLLFRVNAQFNDEQSFRDNVSKDRQFIAPVVSYQIDDHQKITAEAEINHFKQTRDQGIAVINGDLDVLPESRYLGGDTEVDTRIYNFQLTHEWFINPDWALNSKFRIGRDNTDDELFNPVVEAQQNLLNNPMLWGDDEPRVYRTLTSADDIKDEINLDINLVGELDWGHVEHTLLFGININQREVDREAYLHYNDALYQVLSGISPALSFYSAVSYVDPFNPQNPESIFLPAVLGQLNPLLAQEFLYTDKVVLEDTQTNIVSSGVYFQDQIRLNEFWQVILGARYDHNQHDIEKESLSIPAFLGGQITNEAPVDSDQSDGRFTPKAGLVYQPISNVSVYASYGEQYDIALVAKDVKPIESEALEYGVKWDIIPGLSASVAYFDIEKTNIVDPSNLLEPSVVDEVESTGFELSLLGRINPHWVVSANYSDFDAEVARDTTNPQNEGNRARGTPDSSGSAWLQHDFEPYGTNGFSIGFGANYVGARPGDNANSFELPGYILLDAKVSYQIAERFNINLQVDNLTDKRWYSGAFTSQSVFPGYGTRARLALGYEF